jgi:hypothetical protein
MAAMAGLAAGVLPAVPVLATETGVEPASAFVGSRLDARCAGGNA